MTVFTDRSRKQRPEKSVPLSSSGPPVSKTKTEAATCLEGVPLSIRRHTAGHWVGRAWLSVSNACAGARVSVTIRRSIPDPSCSHCSLATALPLLSSQGHGRNGSVAKRN